MKKYILIGAGLLIAASSYAQKGKIRDAEAYLADNDYKKALVAANEAVANSDTKDNPNAWFQRGRAYVRMAVDSTSKDPSATGEAYTSLMKTVSLKPDFEGAKIDRELYTAAVLSFNDGVALFETDPKGAYERFARVINVYKLNGGNRFAKDESFAKIAGTARSNAAVAAVKAGRDDVALGLYKEALATNPDASVYQQIIDIYGRQKNDAEELTALTNARKAFPENEVLRNMEINYYIRTGKSDALVGKLEEAVAAQPNNAELSFNLANIYEQMAWPEKGDKPANQAELVSKSEAAFKKAVTIAPDSADYYYNYGVLYYKAATDFTKQMNAISGTSAAEQKKYDGLLAQRDAQFGRALPLFEQGYALYSRKGLAQMSNSEKITYQNTLIGLREIYSRKNNAEKTKEIRAKLDELK
jgi:tetratricopeptide (TPR) repeat protein